LHRGASGYLKDTTANAKEGGFRGQCQQALRAGSSEAMMKIFPSTDGDALALAPTSSASSAGSFHGLAYYRDLILVLVAKEFKVRYKSTVMGYAWSVLHPLAFALVFFGLFRMVMRIEMRAYPLFLIAGLFPWQWTSNTVISANVFFLGNRTLIKKVRFSRSTLVLAGVLNEALHFAASIPIVLGFMVYFGQPLTVHVLWVFPQLFAIHFAMLLGMALCVATLNLFFRDLERLTHVLMHLMFYLTPVLYAVDRLPPGYEWLSWANPFSSTTRCWQGLFYDGSVAGGQLLLAAAWAAAWLAAGWQIYRSTVWRFAEIV
jgi:lipopolysaccharide transport system permease protein